MGNTVFTQEQLQQIEDYLIDRLPDLLRQDPKIAITIEGILAQHFPRRDEFVSLVEELKALRIEMNQRFEQVDRRFDQVDQRLEQMDRHLEQVDRRLDQVDQHLAQVDQRLEQMDRHLEQVDRRLDQVDQSILGLRRDIARLDHRQEMFLDRLDGQERWLRLSIGDYGNEKGENLETFFAAGLRYGLKDPDIRADQIRLRQSLVDTKGAVFPPGFATEVDLIATDGSLTVFEVKATLKNSDVDFFSLKVRLVRAQHPDQQVRGVLISLGAPDDRQQRAEQQGVELVR